MQRPPGYSVGAFALYFILLYAEDLKIFFPVARNIDFANAQAELDVFFQWCIDSRMQLNLGKCKSLSFTRSRFTRYFQYDFSGHRLDSVDFICDIGVVLDSKPNFTSLSDCESLPGCWVS
jgi:hypothetical protein